MPIYNAAETLPEALNSLLAQSLPDYEVVAVNDGSEDKTGVILQSYADSDTRLRPVELPRVGLIEALNRGLDTCQGKFVARMDADDIAHPRRLELQSKLLQEQPGLSVVSCLVEPFPLKTVTEGFRRYVAWLNALSTPEAIAREIFIESPLPHPSVMLRHAELTALGGYKDHGWAEDYDLWLRYHIAEKQMYKITRTLLHWRDHPTRATRTDSRYSVENFLRAKAHYLVRGPLLGIEAIIIWGSGQMGRRLSKHLIRAGAPLICFLDIDPNKIGKTIRGRPVHCVEELPVLWQKHERPLLLVAVGSKGARTLIRTRLQSWGFKETEDFWCVA
jgi:glycosyltransferase involved in cell wall biosynthesis